ncbi:MAG: hypothetical protein LBP52_03720 [Burkholderiaceae bacterium]|jgi:hypothetical protein|nr:hypothetical protein [Burkholderiaceae bacterium]
MQAAFARAPPRGNGEDGYFCYSYLSQRYFVLPTGLICSAASGILADSTPESMRKTKE